jgi:aryl-alcohol dehydrogenase-like predicted oxidoreductase
MSISILLTFNIMPSNKTRSSLSRREFMRLSAAVAAGITIIPALSCSTTTVPGPLKRRFGKINFDVTTMALGGQGSLQWTPDDVEPVDIILKAFDLGINYFDTSNVYGPSQMNYGKAFRKLKLVPGQEGYNKKLRNSVFITTKTMVRWAKGGYERIENVRNSTEGNHGEGAVADLKRTLSQLFGNDDGAYPEGAYVDMILIHNLMSFEEVDVVYKGLETPLDQDENFGALIALRDYRDGTNITGLNPGNEKLVKHLGFSGHHNAPAMIDMIQRDKWDLLDGMLVAINVNDRRYLNMQYNVIPVAQAKNIGIIGMKVFADGAMYTKEPGWSNTPSDVVRIIGTDAVPSKPLIEYVLTTSGVHTLIIGIGEINDNPLKCQLVQNYYAAQIKPNALNEKERRELEKIGVQARNGETNYFQMSDRGLTPPQNATFKKDDLNLTWDTSLAGDEPISHYEIISEGTLIGTVNHTPQTSKEPFKYRIVTGKTFKIVAVDAAGRRAETAVIMA